MRPGQGYDYNPEELRSAAEKFQHAADELSSVAKSDFQCVNAGLSSKQANKTISDLMTAVLMAAAQCDRVARTVHATKGTYGDAEETNKGVLGTTDGDGH